MQLVRDWGLPKAVKSHNQPPAVNGNGVFLAPANANDLPLKKISYHHGSFLLKHGDLWMGDLRDSSSDKWIKIHSIDQVPKFQKVYRDRDWDSPIGIDVGFVPYPAEFFWMPRSAKGFFHLRRSQWRAWNRA